MITLRSERKRLGLLIVLAGCFYAAVSRLYTIGIISDDAIYLLAARSLLLGKYVALNLPGHPPLLYPPPGFPLLLSLFIGWLPIPALKTVPWALMLSSLVLFWTLGRRWLSTEGCFLMTCLLAFNPWVVQFATYLMSESLFIFMLLSLSLWLVRLLSTRDHPWEGILFGISLGYACWVRADGLALFLGMLAGLAASRRWHLLGTSAIGSSFMIGAWSLRNAFVDTSGPGYLSYWREILAANPSVLQIASAQFQWLQRVYVQALLGQDGMPAAISSVLTLVLLGFIGRAVYLELKRKSPESYLVFAWAVFGLLYSLLHGFWSSDEVRYALPLLPLIYLALGRSVLSFSGKRKIVTKGILLLLLLIAGAKAVLTDKTLAQTSFQMGALHFPRASYSWMHDHLDPNSVVLASAPAAIHLYTGAYATNLAPARDAESFRYILLEKKIGHVLVAERLWARMAFSKNDEAAIWRHRLHWLQLEPAAYTPLYTNTQEQTALYQVTAAPVFQRAYRRANDAFELVETGSYTAAFQAAEESIRMDSHLLAGRTAYAIAALLSGSHQHRAETLLQEAVRWSPTYALGHINLARLLRQTGDAQRASEEYRRALQVIEETGDFKSLIPQLTNEWKAADQAH